MAIEQPGLEAYLARAFGSIPELIHLHAEREPGHAALIQGTRQLSYGELDTLMDRIAAGLQRDGMRPGDTIAVCGSSSIEYAAVFLGALRAGVAVAPLAPSSTPESLVAMLTDSAAKLLFVDQAIAQVLEPVRAQLHATVVTLDDSAPLGPQTTKAWSRWLAASGAAPEPVKLDPEAPFNIIYSSGTTGTPKGIVQPNRMRWAHVRRAADAGYGTDAVTLVSTPLYSNTTLVSFFPGIALGGAIVLMEKFDAREFLELSEKHRATHAMLVPVQYQRILDFPEFGRFDLKSYVLKFCTSAPFSAALKKRVLTHWPGGLIEYYGMTEGGGTCVLSCHEFSDKLHTVGRPVFGHDIRLIDEEGHEVAAGEVGEVVGASPIAMMLGYHNQPGKTADATWTDPTGKRFIRTGDVGRFDPDGFLTLLDRKKDMIISGGFNVYPSDLEAVLIQHPAVRDAAVVGVPSHEWGETPIAFVVREPSASEEAEQIRSWVNERLGKTQRVRAIELVPELVRSPIGKVLKRELRDGWIKRNAQS